MARNAKTNQTLHPELPHLPYLETILLQDPRTPGTPPRAPTDLEVSNAGLYHWTPRSRRHERHSCSRGLFFKNGALHPDHARDLDRRIGITIISPRMETLQNTGGDNLGLRPSVCFSSLETPLPTARHHTKTQYRLPPAKGWTDRANQHFPGTVSPRLREPQTEQLVRLPAPCHNLPQQRCEQHNQDKPILRRLWIAAAH